MRKKNFLFIILLFVFIYILNSPPISDKIRGYFYELHLPRSSFFKIERVLSYFSSKKNLVKENERLKSEIFLLKSENEKLKDLERENEDLKKIIGIKKEDYHYEISQIIFRDISDEVIFINHGKDKEFSFGNVVITPDNVVVGRIEKVFNNSSAVSLISKRGMVFDVKISENVFGIAKGVGDGKVVIENIPQREKIKKGDYVFTSNLSELFPPDLIVGQIEKVEKTDITSFQRAIVKTLISPCNLRNLFVIK